ncbi:NAD(P)H-dependent oxidoreductase [Pseudooctadecabacter jejudonensis]|uniref:Glutathione-regulated potassium-efflux system ancillary protein KefF n=1 Tax=Pseudooctadecabacter jejudonensis TaxID=1391910 RepID=A0A1Y5T4L6_9RHOB|nr:NAD(P)H-dependent oxidoreductase [Pseudooctadecabacter jejudonensis]SLN55697.1 Glutathione-regulated potassium-efflux system ancillary protein KefF [Pseudooctadecabacter jejudonensis]
MHILTVIDHPNPASFSHAIAARFMDGGRAAGHTVEAADLHAEGFNPLWTQADIEAEGAAALPADIRAEQDRIARADAISLVFPLFWWGMPSMMKGWVDRVWSWGWAYDQLSDPDVSLQRPRSGILLIPAGTRSDEMEAEGYTDALSTLWMNGTFGYFGLAPRRIELLCGSTGSDSRRATLLDRAYHAGLTLPPAKAITPSPPPVP